MLHAALYVRLLIDSSTNDANEKPLPKLLGLSDNPQNAQLTIHQTPTAAPKSPIPCLNPCSNSQTKAPTLPTVPQTLQAPQIQHPNLIRPLQTKRAPHGEKSHGVLVTNRPPFGETPVLVMPRVVRIPVLTMSRHGRGFALSLLSLGYMKTIANSVDG